MEAKKEGTKNEAILTCFDVVLKAIETQQQDCETELNTGTKVTKDMLQAYAEALSHEITKFVVFTEKASPDLEAMVGLCEGLTKHINAVVAVLRAMLVHAGAAKRRFTVQATKQMLSGMTTIMEQTKASTAIRLSGEAKKNKTSEKSEKKEVDSDATASLVAGINIMALTEATAKVSLEAHTGAAWGYCKVIMAIPMTNSMAMGKDLAQHLAMIKDAKSEIKELKDGEGDDGFGDDEDEDEGEEALTPDERARVEPCLELLTVVYNVLRKVYEFVLRCQSSDAEVKHVEWLDRTLVYAKAMVSIVDDMGSCLYAPQDEPLLASSFAIMSKSIDDLLANFPSHPAFYQTFATTFKKTGNDEKKREEAEVNKACDAYIVKFRKHVAVVAANTAITDLMKQADH